MDITRWSILKSDWLCSLQPKMETFYTVSKNRARSWLWHRPWTPIAKFRLKLKKVGKTTRLFSHGKNLSHGKTLKWTLDLVRLWLFGSEDLCQPQFANLWSKENPGSIVKWKVKWSEVAQSCPTLCNPLDSSLHQAPPSVGFSRQEYWSGLPFPSPGIEPRSPALQTDALLSEPPGKPPYMLAMCLFLVTDNHKDNYINYTWQNLVPYS